MLSRVAETIYWFSRYLERAENTARIILVNTHLLLDLPKDYAPGWGLLIEISGASDLYTKNSEAYDYSEQAVVKFMIANQDNPASIIKTLEFARENTRTIRDFIPRSVWEQTNEVYWLAKDQLESGLSKRGRFSYLSTIIQHVQTIRGSLEGAMNKDAGYSFLRLGQDLERADMTTRIIDVRCAQLMFDTPSLEPYQDIQWMSVLKSLGAYHMYRRTGQSRVTGYEVVRFLLTNPHFPRSFFHCVQQLTSQLESLKSQRIPLSMTNKILSQCDASVIVQMHLNDLHEFIDGLQISLGELHNEIVRCYFFSDIAKELPQAEAC